MTGFVLAAPVVSGDVAPSTDQAAGEDLVVMGLDGAPTSARSAAEVAPNADGIARVGSTASRDERSALPVPTPAPSPAPVEVPPPPAAVPTEADRAGQVLALVNRERAAAGCRPLAADSRLATVAAAHSADMRDRGFFDHVNLAGLGPFDRAEAAGTSARAENIARGQRDAAAVMDSWMDSPGHRSNILDCGVTRLGVGIADGGGGPWWTQLFA